MSFSILIGIWAIIAGCSIGLLMCALSDIQERRRQTIWRKKNLMSLAHEIMLRGASRVTIRFRDESEAPIDLM